MSKQVIARLVGGIGNQMFIYAASRRLALLNNAELVLDNISGFTRDKIYKRNYQLDKFNVNCRFATSDERMDSISYKIKQRLNRTLLFSNKNYIKEHGIGFDERLLHINFKGNLYLDGYWQSENYFKDISSVLLKDFTFKKPFDIKNIDMSEKIKKNESVMLHVRFHDLLHVPEPFQVSSEYYSLALKLIARLLDNPHFFIFSDNPQKAKNWLPLPKSAKVTLVDHNTEDSQAYADLWLMTQCKHFIIANSSFSWWGAWLSQFEDKYVLAPNICIHDFYPLWRGTDGFLPKRWIKI